jgi:hypothetical protein
VPQLPALKTSAASNAGSATAFQRFTNICLPVMFIPFMVFSFAQ